jgi:hypothetical protein
MLKKIILAVGLALVNLSITASACEWIRVEADMRWCLVDGHGVQGRGEMIRNLQAGDSNRIGGVENGFRDCQNSGGVRSNFKSCKDENQGRLYNVGRHILGLPDV